MERWARHHHAARTGEHVLWRWTDAELKVLEEERLTASAQGFAESIGEQYSKLMMPIARQFPDFVPPAEITREEFLHAAAVAMSQRVLVDGVGGHVHGAERRQGEFYAVDRDLVYR